MDPITLKMLIFVAIIAISFGLGFLISRALRLRDLGGKIGLVLFTLGFGLSPFINTVLVEKKPWTEALRFGIDLAGGTNLVYQLAAPPRDLALMDRMVGAIRRRIDPGGVQELAIRQVGRDRIELIIPKASPEAVEAIKKKMTTVGNLEFHILANQRDHKDLILKAQAVSKELRVGNRVVAEWLPIAPITSEEGERVANRNFPLGGDIVVRDIKNPKPGYFQEVLVVVESDAKRRVTGEYLQRANPDMDEGGRPAVSFVFNQRGAYLFSQLTGANKPLKDGFQRRLAIALDDEVASAPSLRDAIGARGIIEGNFTAAEVKELVDVLNAGALEVPLKKDPISEFTISPLLGIDVQQKGMRALICAMLAIFVFMAYYKWLGFVSDMCLVLNLILLVGCMAMIDATFTLPGLAGIVLTMGMAVDANVLIYERMREELQRGSSLRMAIHNGFGKAFSAIFDSNITTLLTAVILYMIGSDQVKGFAVTLFIGLSVSMYTALTVNRLVLEIVERKRWLKRFSMFSLFGETKIDFVAKRFVAYSLSIALIAVGLLAFAYRGEANYDIDFTGGTMVTMEFTKPIEADEVQQKLTEAFKSDITLEQLTASNRADGGRLFRMRTTEQDDAKVRQVINDAFQGSLKIVTMEYGKIAPIAAAAEKPADAATAGGGHRAELTFSSPVSTDNIARNLMDEIAKIKDSDQKPKYGSAEELQNLITLSGTDEKVAPSGVAGQMQKFDKMVLEADPALAEADLRTSLSTLQTTLANTPNFEEVNNFESAVANETKQSAILAMLASLIMIIGYIWFRFENLYFGLAAVLALVHDVLATLGLVCLAALVSHTPLGPALMLTDFKINLTMIAAFLTIVGYSINDTIVIFDRLREIRGKNPSLTGDMINLAVNQTLSRTILTSGTVFVTVIILYIMGGEGIHGFAFAMLMGTIVGCYSTVYVASPFLLYLMGRSAAAQRKAHPNRTALASAAK